MTRPAHLVVYRDLQGAWRWQVRSANNGLIIAASSEGFTKRSTALRNMHRTRDALISGVLTVFWQ